MKLEKYVWYEFSEYDYVMGVDQGVVIANTSTTREYVYVPGVSIENFFSNRTSVPDVYVAYIHSYIHSPPHLRKRGLDETDY
jgi:hypothetical protein